MAGEQETKESKGPCSVRLSSIVMIVVSFLVGVFLALTISQALQQRDIALSPVGLISFFFAVALGGASIVLAVVAIVFSRVSEGNNILGSVTTRTPSAKEPASRLP